MKKTYRIDRVLEGNLNEQDVDPDEENKEEKEPKKSKYEKDKETERKDIEDVDKDDLEDEEKSDTIEDEEVAVAITKNAMNNEIKLISFKRLSSLVSIESILKLFNINPNKVESGFEEKMEISIKSPLPDFSDQEYKIRLMDKIGEISIKKEGFNQTLTKKSPATTTLQQAVTQQVGDETAAEKESEKTETVNLDYLPDLNYDFKKSIKNEFFDRIIGSKNK